MFVLLDFVVCFFTAKRLSFEQDNDKKKSWKMHEKKIVQGIEYMKVNIQDT